MTTVVPRWRWLLAGLVAILIAATLMAPGPNPNPIYRPSGPTAYGIDSAELEDLATIAEDEGITLNQAVRLYGWQTAFGEDVERLRRENPKTYSYAESGYPPLIRFKGEAPDDIQDAFSNLPVHVKVKVDDSALYSEREMAAMREVATDAADVAVGKSGDLALMELDDATGAIDVDLGHLDGIRQTEPAAVKQHIKSALTVRFPNLAMPKITVRVPKELPVGSFG